MLTFVLVPESRDPNVPAIDIRGLATSILLLGVLVYTIIEAPVNGWHSSTTLIGFAAAAALALAFVKIEQAAEHPMLDVRLFTDRRFSAASAIGGHHLFCFVRLHLPDHSVLPGAA
ncbi:MAG TPA: hypothetical protein VGC05_05490 [Mycobacterium sp.]